MQANAANGAVSAAGPTESSSILQNKHLADKRESEFNHRIAGLFLVLSGIVLVGQDRLVRRWPRVRYVWPLCFLVIGLFLFVFSDTEIQPWGQQTMYHAVMTDSEVLQHKVWAVILIIVAYVEAQRVRGRFHGEWSTWLFPILSFCGAALLLFHRHALGMHTPGAMAIMEHIQSQHLWYASVGFGIVVARALSVSKSRWQRLWHHAWPVLLIVLGASMTFYTE
jgi:drug/metabolite transporter (DMT)-like permease